MAKKKTILLIEDEVYLLDMYKMKLEKEGYKVLTAIDGETGIKITREKKPDLILLDIILPEMDGYEVLEVLKNDSTTKDIKIFVLSNLGQDEEVALGKEKGADDYLIKANLTPIEIVKKINQAFYNEEMEAKRETGNKAGKKPLSGRQNENGLKILFIEDNREIVEMYRIRMEKEGFNIEVADNGAWGLKLAQGQRYSVIVMDMVMPAMGGLELLKGLKKSASNKETPIIVLSNSAQDEDIEEAKDNGADSYLLKANITPARLIKEIKSLLNK